MPKRQTFRPRDSKLRTMAADHVFTYWVGQRVARTWERTNYQDRIGQVATVTKLPERGSWTMEVELADGTKKRWDASECRPLRELHRRNAKRLRARAQQIADFAELHLDGNGVEVTRTKEAQRPA